MSGSLEQHLNDAVSNALRARTHEIIEEEISRAVKAVQDRLRAETAKIVLSVLQQYSLERGQRELIIRVKHEEGMKK